MTKIDLSLWTFHVCTVPTIVTGVTVVWSIYLFVFMFDAIVFSFC